MPDRNQRGLEPDEETPLWSCLPVFINDSGYF